MMLYFHTFLYCTSARGKLLGLHEARLYLIDKACCYALRAQSETMITRLTLKFGRFLDGVVTHFLLTHEASIDAEPTNN